MGFLIPLWACQSWFSYVRRSDKCCPPRCLWMEQWCEEEWFLLENGVLWVDHLLRCDKPIILRAAHLSIFPRCLPIYFSGSPSQSCCRLLLDHCLADIPEFISVALYHISRKMWWSSRNWLWSSDLRLWATKAADDVLCDESFYVGFFSRGESFSLYPFCKVVSGHDHHFFFGMSRWHGAY